MAEQSSSEPTVVVERRSGGGIGLFLLGIAVGAGLALLYAPQSGAETRQDLRRGGRRLRRQARAVVEDAREAAEELAQTTRNAAREVVHTTRDAAREVVQEARGAAHEAREALERRLAKHGRGATAADEVEDGGV